MGEQKVTTGIPKEEKNRFIHHLLRDLDALEFMLNEGWFERDVTRIGAEQELCLVDPSFRPSTEGPAILETIKDPHFTTELARYNLEINLDPLELKAGAFATMEMQLQKLIADARRYAEPFGSKVLLCGILPSITPRELDLSYLTPKPRYHTLDNTLRNMRGGDFEVMIQGNDELMMRHNNILLEACNTSFQVHLQVDPYDFSDMYNWAQMISGPVLAACTNSPLLFGKELWAETRIALFQQSLDIRTKTNHLRQFKPRVNFGNQWLTGGITDIIKDDIARFPLILITDTEDSSELVKDGKVPKLKAFSLHNGTIWKWNRPCYGITNGKPHLRIECRYIPSGPCISDEIANAAFWVGLMKGLTEKYRDLPSKIDFNEVRENFIKAARYGIHTELRWMGRSLSARELLLRELIPMAMDGLIKSGLGRDEASAMLGIIAERVEGGHTGSWWAVKQFRELKKYHDTTEAQLELTAIMYENQVACTPVSSWHVRNGATCTVSRMKMAEDFMTTDILSVKEDDPAELVVRMMQWRDIHHVPVENEKGEMTGLITARNLENFLRHGRITTEMTAGDVMIRQFISIPPGTGIMEAMQMMIQAGVSCLPVLKDEKLAGIVTDRDMERVWEKLKGEEKQES